MDRKRCDTQGSRYLTKIGDLDFRHAFAQTLGNEHGSFAVGLRQDYHKLIPTESRRGINSPQFGALVIRQHAERHVAGIVSGLIVNVFVIVEVEHY